MDESPYKLCCALLGHSEDVRAMAKFDDGTLVSTSRDKTARIWKPHRNGKEYIPGDILKGHTNFVSSVCVLNPSERYPSSLIITGSNDKNICIYVLGEVEPMHKIKAHDDTVCNLRTGYEDGTFLSSSWDLSAKLWSLDSLKEPKLILKNHSLAVWCVADLPNKTIITGSADKMAIVWTRDGTILHKLKGHTDCIRDIAVLNENDFLTCSNDATICHWNSLSGICLGTYSGHENYIYGISALLNGSKVISSGEDKTVRVWKNAELDQTIIIPACSVWCVQLLPNLDIAAGSSDGIIRIFSSNPDRYADSEVLEIWENEVIEHQNKMQLETAVKINELPDPSALEIPGNRDGQTKMIKENGKAIAYSWSNDQQSWVRIGEVIGTDGGDSSKKLYNGVEYDYVFSVDIQEGMPPIKLPYNKTEDPWLAAQKFIHQHELSQMFLDQVANFIVKNSNSTPALLTNSSYADPFTGGNRYIPNSTSTTSTTTNSNADPFTGGSRYIPNTEPMEISSTPIRSYFPHIEYLKIERANHDAILEKLKEVNGTVESASRISEEKLVLIVNLAKGEQINESQLDLINEIWKLLNWPDNLVFPGLDVIRLAVLFKGLVTQLDTDKLFNIVKRHLKPDALPANQMLVFRLLANIFSQDAGGKFVLKHSEEILDALSHLESLGSKNNQIAISTFVLNLAVALSMENDMTARRTQLLRTIMAMLPKLKEHEAIFRTLVAFGTVLAGSPTSGDKNTLTQIVRVSNSTMDILKTFGDSSSSFLDPQKKVTNCSKQILEFIA